MSLLDDMQKRRRAKRNGVNRPRLALKCARKNDLPFFAACALLTMESAGGDNVFGSDPTCFIGTKMEEVLGDRRVTKERYLLYTLHREEMGAQGVGGCQLTFIPLQKEADADGGCWVPEVNYNAGFRLLKSFRQQGMDWKECGTHYNGSEEYGRRFARQCERFKAIFDAPAFVIRPKTRREARQSEDRKVQTLRESDSGDRSGPSGELLDSRDNVQESVQRRTADRG